jgi:hypothetical protein
MSSDAAGGAFVDRARAAPSEARAASTVWGARLRMSEEGITLAGVLTGHGDRSRWSDRGARWPMSND